MPTDESRFMEPLLLAGRLIMENGGETYRVEETITRMGRAFGLSEVESFAVPSGLFVSYRRGDGGTETAVKRVHKGPTNLCRVDEVNAVSRLVEQEGLSCEDTLRRLQDVASGAPLVKRPLLLVAAAICAAGFAGMFGGDAADMLISGVTALMVQGLTQLAARVRITGLAATLLGSLLSTLLPMLLSHFTGLGHVQPIVAGTLMPLLPGLAMTNAVQDTIRGDMISGLAHGILALLTAALVAGGALCAAALMQLMGGAAL